MTPSSSRSAPVGSWRDWRAWPRLSVSLWRHSLTFRTLTITIALSSLAVFITCVIMALVIQNDLFESRKDDALLRAKLAVTEAQRTLEDSVSDDRVALQTLWVTTIQEQIARTAASNMVTAAPIEAGPGIPNGFRLGLSVDDLSPELRNRVIELTDPPRQAWQPGEVTSAGNREAPGIIVGQQLIVPDVGAYELYIAYDFSDANETLLFVQRTLWIAGLGLVAIIAVISWFVLRAVTAPIVDASETSARLASGDLAVRLPVSGSDELATLAESFNGMADSIEAQIKELGELSLVQQRFVSDVSHELRTPLTTIRMAADMINDQRQNFDETTARTAELLHAQVQRFDVLLADLLEISRYDAGSVQLDLEDTSLAALAEDVVDQLRPLAETHGDTELRLIAPGGYTPVPMDPRRVRRVLRNLIGNAIEHGEGLPIVVTVDSDQQAVAVGVRDRGLGMSPDDVHRVFDRFWRADPSRTRTIGGSGLGLSIALGDARLHGGTLEVWSELGAGTNFVLTIPRTPGALQESRPVSVEPENLADGLETFTQPIVLDVTEADAVEVSPHDDRYSEKEESEDNA